MATPKNALSLVETGEKKKTPAQILKEVAEMFEDEGISLFEHKFIDEWLKNGFNGTKAYLKLKPDVKESSARTLSSKILTKVNIQGEIKARFARQNVTESIIVQELFDIGTNYREEKELSAAVQALGILAKHMGMLTEDKKKEFTEEHPAMFLPPMSAERMEEMRKRRQNMGRLAE